MEIGGGEKAVSLPGSPQATREPWKALGRDLVAMSM